MDPEPEPGESRGSALNPPLPLGTMTRWGKIAMVGWVGERYYWMVKGCCVAMMPAGVVEASVQSRVLPAE